jgi:hypothetical protein
MPVISIIVALHTVITTKSAGSARYPTCPTAALLCSGRRSRALCRWSMGQCQLTADRSLTPVFLAYELGTLL